MVVHDPPHGRAHDAAAARPARDALRRPGERRSRRRLRSRERGRRARLAAPRQRSDFTAALIAFVAGVAAAALASLQVDYARGVLVGGGQVLDYTGLRLSSLPPVLFTATGLAALLAFGAVPRRRGEPWVVGCLGSFAGVFAVS